MDSRGSATKTVYAPTTKSTIKPQIQLTLTLSLIKKISTLGFAVPRNLSIMPK